MIGNHIQSTDQHKPTTTNAKRSIVNVMPMIIDATRMIGDVLSMIIDAMRAIGNVIRMLDDIQQSFFILVNPTIKASSSICRY